MIEKIELVGGETLYIDKGGYPHPYYVKELSAGEFELLSDKEQDDYIFRVERWNLIMEQTLNALSAKKR